MKKIILSSFLMIALSLMIISGATYALFTSEAKTDISITSGKVDVTSSIVDLKLYSMDQEQEDNFENGGTAGIGLDGSISLNLMTPGDKVTFDIVITNNSNVNVMARTIIGVESDDYTLFNGLNIAIDEDSDFNQYLAVSQWESLGEEKRINVSIELPVTAGNEYQDLACELFVAIEAVQANGVEQFESVIMSEVSDELELLDALEAGVQIIVLKDNITITNGQAVVVPADTIILGGNYTLDLTGTGQIMNFGFSLLTTNNSVLLLNGQNIKLNNLNIFLGNSPIIVSETAVVELNDVTIVGLKNAAIGIYNQGTLEVKLTEITFNNPKVPESFRIVNTKDAKTSVNGIDNNNLTEVEGDVNPLDLAINASILFETLFEISKLIDENAIPENLAQALAELKDVAASLGDLDESLLEVLEAVVEEATETIETSVDSIIRERVRLITESMTSNNTPEQALAAIMTHGEAFGINTALLTSLSTTNQLRAVGILKDAVAPYEEFFEGYLTDASLDEIFEFQAFLNTSLSMFGTFVAFEEQFAVVFDENGTLNPGKTASDAYGLSDMVDSILSYQYITWHERQLQELMNELLAEKLNIIKTLPQIIYVNTGTLFWDNVNRQNANNVGKVVVLTSDITLAKNVEIAANVIIDGNGYKLTFEGTNLNQFGGNMIMDVYGTGVQIRNLHIINKVEVEHNILQWNARAVTESLVGYIKNVIIENQNTIGVKAGLKLKGLSSKVTAEVTVNNVTTLNTGWSGIYVEGYSTLNVQKFGYHEAASSATDYWQLEIAKNSALSAIVNVDPSIPASDYVKITMGSYPVYMSTKSYNRFVSNPVNIATAAVLKSFVGISFAQPMEIVLTATFTVSASTVVKSDVTITIPTGVTIRNIERLTAEPSVNCTLVIKDGATVTGAISDSITVVNE